MIKIKEPFTTAAVIYPVIYKNIKGTEQRAIDKEGSYSINCSFKSYGGTERVINDMIVIDDTADITTWHDERTKAGYLLELETGELYEIISAPENIEKRNMYSKFKVRRKAHFE